MMGAIIFMILLAIYFLPAIMAYNRKSQKREAVLVINLFLGWTFIGWVVALAMAVTGEEKQ